MVSSKFHKQVLGLLAGYGLQFLAGMLLNLFFTIPAIRLGNSGTEYFRRSWHSLIWALSGQGGWELVFHVSLALLLVIGSFALFIRTVIEQNKDWSIAGGVAALFTLGAFFNGLSFVDYGYNISSMIMATCWLVAVGALIFGLVKFSPKPAKTHAR